MNLHDLVPGLPRQFWERMIAIGRTSWLKLDPHPERDTADVYVRKDTALPAVVQLMLSGLPSFTPNDLFTVEALGELAANGPKLFDASDEQCEALEHVDIRLTVGEYEQPFPALLIRMGSRFVAELRAAYPECGIPDYILLRHYREEKLLYLLGVCRDKPIPSGDNCLVMVHNNDRTMEQSMAKAYELPTEDAVVMSRLYRVALNAALLLMIGGHTAAPSNAKHLAKCSRRRTPGNDFEAASHVYFLALQQRIRVKEAQRREPGDGHHASPHPHWRRGHMARQRYGIGRALTKLVYRPAVFVRGGAFGGDLSDSSATYSK